MPLKQSIAQDVKTAMLSKDNAKRDTLRLLQAAVKQKEVDERIELDDAGVIAVLDKMIKQRNDSITAFTLGGRKDLADKEHAELAVLQPYLPVRLSVDEVATEVRAIVAELRAELGTLGPGDMGKVMGTVKARLAGKADMGAVSVAVKAALTGI